MTRALGGRRSPYVIAHDRELVRRVMAERGRLTDAEFYDASDLVVERLTDRERMACEQILCRLGIAVEKVESYKGAIKAARRKAKAAAPKHAPDVQPGVLQKLPLLPPGRKAPEGAKAWRDRA